MAKTNDYGLSRGSKGAGNRPNGNFNNHRNSNNNYSGQRNSFGGGQKSGGPRPGGNAPRPYEGRPATAPYNFIPLPRKAMLSPLGNKIIESLGTAKFVALSEKEQAKLFADNYVQYIADEGKLSGYIDYSLEALTPVYVGDNGKFFAPTDVATIPGSTMRGLVKNLLKIISCGTMRGEENEDFTDKHLYFRAFASKKSTLKEKYMERMSKNVIFEKRVIDKITKQEKIVKEPRVDANVSGGFLVEYKDQKGKYFIVPAQKESCAYERTRRNGKWQYISNNEPKVEWLKDGAYIHSGKMMGKGHYFKICNPAWDRPIPIPEGVLSDFKVDEEKQRAIKNLKILKNKASGHDQPFARGQGLSHLMPCFYVADEKENVVTSFGPTKYYRIPYDNSISKHVPGELRKPESVDFADAIFGRKEDWASRVFFDDAPSENALALPSEKSHNLMSPNPTSFQLYLEQSDGNIKHWDDDVKLRGYKLYWHKNIDNSGWKFNPNSDMDIKGTQAIKPVRAGAIFNGRIRFSRLSKEELGALLTVLRLRDYGPFKIGMGKSIGMGSVKLTKYDMHLFDNQARYGSLFAEKGWLEGIQDASIESYEKIFDDYMNKAGMYKEYQKILENLSIMMSWENTKRPKWNEQLDYMKISKEDRRYIERVPLGTPKEIQDRAGKL